MNLPSGYEQVQTHFTSSSRGTRMGRRVANNVAELAPNLQPPIICVGCGDGLEVEHMLQHFGISVEENAKTQQIIGLEVTNTRVLTARAAGLPVFEGPAENILEVLNGTKRNIYCAHCLEHCFSAPTVIENFKKAALDTIVIVVPIEVKGRTVNKAHYFPIANLGYIANMFGMDWRISITYRWNVELEGVLVLKRDPMNWPSRPGRTFSSELLLKGSF